MLLLLQLVLFGLLPATLLAWPLDRRDDSQRPKSPVCIVGAGPAGLTAARKLEGKGYSTVIFDKQPEVGGKCQTYYTKYAQRTLTGLTDILADSL